MSFKCTESVTIHLPHDMEQTLRADAHAAGCAVGEFVRDMICLHQHGLTFGELVANHRREVLKSKVAKAAQLRSVKEAST